MNDYCCLQNIKLVLMLRCIICNQSNLLTGCTLALVILYVMNLIFIFFL